ncbi:hypothetical protein, conserved [Babesia ovata]|uniref:Extracellular matrix-binding ebh n=1 Tax=Babesia ovata TaxID=189622 RepID=A0A2H6KJY3_9APIC|nr:uncharacterized protein BOVATA_047820 [Babesia ovata]GBE63289.1 hypothetical protein, conserved [Babesia ovata]
MSFLHGVLESVKDDESVKHYYSTAEMDKILEKIKNSMHQKGALREWDDGVWTRTTALNNALNSLQTNIFNDIDTSLRALSRCGPADVARNLHRCIRNAERLPEAVSSAYTKHGELDRELRKKLLDHLRKIEIQVTSFVSAASNGELKEVVERAKIALGTMRKNVDDSVRTRIAQLQHDLEEAFRTTIKEPIEYVAKALERVNSDLWKWMSEAHSVITKADEKAREVYGRLNDRKYDDGKKVIEKTELCRKLEQISTAKEKIDIANGQLEAKVLALDGWISTEHGTIEGALGKIAVIMKEVDGPATKKAAIIDEANKLYGHATSLLEASVTAKTRVTVAVQEAVRTLEGLNAKVSEALEAFKKEMNPIISGCLSSLENVRFASNKVTNLGSLPQSGLVAQWLQNIQTEGGALRAFDSLHYDGSTVLTEIFNVLKADLRVGTIKSNRIKFFKALDEDMQNAIKDITDLTNPNDPMKPVRDQLKGDNGSNLHKAVSDITQNVKELTESTKKDALTIEIFGCFDKVRNTLDSLCSEVKTQAGDSSGLQKELAGLQTRIGKNTKDDTCLGGIQKKLCELHKDELSPQPELITLALSSIQKELGELQEVLSTDVIKALDDLLNKGILRDQKWKQTFGLDNIHNEIAGILYTNPVNLTAIIAQANTFLTQTIPQQAAIALEGIKNYVAQEVESTTKAIQSKAKEDYYNKINKMFNDMKSCVSNYIAEIEAMFDRDLSTGVKYLMRHLRGKVDGQADQQPPPQPNSSLLDGLRTAVGDENPQHWDKVKKLVDAFKSYVDPIFDFIEDQFKSPSFFLPNVPGKKSTDESDRIFTIHSALQSLLSHVSDKKHFTHEVPGMLAQLKTSVQALTSTKFASPAYPVLDAFPKSLVKFVEQLEKGYVNRYEGHPDTEEWKEFIKAPAQSPPDKYVLTSYGTNLSKVLLTLMEGLQKYITDLRRECNSGGKWSKHTINSRTELGRWLKDRGFSVSKSDKQEGELDSTKNGWKIYGLLCGTVGAKKVFALDPTNGNDYSLVERLRQLFRKYYAVCQHIHIDKPRSPSNIYQMLCWLSGFYFNPMYNKMEGQFKTLFPKPDGQQETDYRDIEASKLTLPATTPFTAHSVVEKLGQVCLHSQLVLVAILGHGDADGRYAIDFSTNPDNLNYPNNSDACFDMLTDILYRVCHQCSFLYVQCGRPYNAVSWLDCWYGKGVGGSSWNCNDLKCPNQTCSLSGNQTVKQSAGQKGNQNADQRCNQHPTCGLKSPLQSFLEDGLQGFLPHTFKTPGCKLECSLNNHNGLPCKTPMGFADIGVTASQSSKGKRIKELLERFCGTKSSPLNALCSYIRCLLQKPPQTLDDMFAFYYHFLYRWNDSGTHRKGAFEEAVKKANFENQETQLDITAMFKSTNHMLDKESSHAHEIAR